MRFEKTTHGNRTWFQIVGLLCCFLVSACASTPGEQTHYPLSNARHLPNPDLTIEIPSLSNCTQPEDSSLHLDSHKPVTVIVHGCFSSAARFRSLADVFAFHGQQTICFNYNDRDSLSNSSAELITAIETLSAHLLKPEITIIGHSQGGLLPTVDRHLKIATDELETCRQYNDHGNCIEDDFVFSLDEQKQTSISDDRNLSSVVVKAGHVEIVGNGKTEPTKLIDILQQEGVLNPTLPERAKELSLLMEQLYLDERGE